MVSNIQISPKNTAQKHQREPNISKYSRAVLTGVLENFKIDCFFIRIYKPVNNNDIGRKRNLIGYLLNNLLLKKVRSYPTHNGPIKYNSIINKNIDLYFDNLVNGSQCNLHDFLLGVEHNCILFNQFIRKIPDIEKIVIYINNNFREIMVLSLYK